MATTNLQTHLDQHATRSGHPLQLRVRLTSLDTVCRMAEAGVGLAIVPERAARRCRRSMALCVVRLTDGWSVRHLTICVRRLDALPLHARQLVEHLRLVATARPNAR